MMLRRFGLLALALALGLCGMALADETTASAAGMSLAPSAATGEISESTRQFVRSVQKGETQVRTVARWWEASAETLPTPSPENAGLAGALAVDLQSEVLFTPDSVSADLIWVEPGR